MGVHSALTLLRGKVTGFIPSVDEAAQASKDHLYKATEMPSTITSVLVCILSAFRQNVVILSWTQ